VSTTLQRLGEPGDAELISAVRGGDVDAYGELFSRHVDAARRLARQLVPAADADDLVSEAFAKVLSVLQRGGGPDLAFRAYLLTAVRRLHVDRIRATSRLHTTDDLTPFDPGVPFRDTAVEGFENAAAARAFASLPERWQMVLWHTEVEGQKPAEVAPLLGMTANSVAALAYRAREGLRQAFLTMHVQELDTDMCSWTHRNLGAFIRNGTSRRDSAKIEDHLAECRRCTAIYLELTEVNSNLAGVLAPVLLGGLAAAYVGSAASGVALKGGVLFLVDRVRDAVVSHAPASAAAGVAASVVVGGAVFMSVHDPAPSRPSAEAGSAVLPGDSADAELPAPVRVRGGGQRGEGHEPLPLQQQGDVAAPVDVPTPSSGPAENPDNEQTEPTDPNEPTDPTDPTAEPPAPEPSAPATDLAVTAFATAQAPGVFKVVVVVSGATSGTATLAIEGDGLSAALTGDGRCGLALGSGTCQVTGASTTYDFTALAPPDGSSALVFTVSAPGGADAEPGNNSARVVLAE
jgi:RNA polymerase sigma factor (sigma-70 family)